MPAIELVREARRSITPEGVIDHWLERAAASIERSVRMLAAVGRLPVSNTIRATFAAGRSDCLRLLFSGKLDVFDIPALCEAHGAGLLRSPRHLPPG